jgi:hypothetical protein
MVVEGVRRSSEEMGVVALPQMWPLGMVDKRSLSEDKSCD